jgi:hypothetical protein
MHDSCQLDNITGHQCVHVCEITEAAGTEDVEADAEYECIKSGNLRGARGRNLH